MKTSTTIYQESVSATVITAVMIKIMNALTMPIQWLRLYYADCINEARAEEGLQPLDNGKPLSVRKTLHLLHIQTAFLCAAFAVTASITLHIVLIAWFVATLMMKVE